MTQINLNHVSRTYDDGTQAVRSLDLMIPSGSFMVLLGPSGCGKSTLLRTIAGVDPLSDGSITFDGKDVSDLAANKRKVAMVFQNFTLYPNMNVYKNLAFPLEVQKLPQEEIDKRVKKVAHMLGLTAVLNRKSKSLSGGQRQRTALGRALINEPDIFLFDEPLSNLDQASRTQLRKDIMAIHEKLGATFIYVTHDQTEAMEMGTHIAVMNEGRIEQVGTPMQIYENPQSVFAAGFLGRPKMNFLTASASCSSVGWDINILGETVHIPANRIMPQYQTLGEKEVTVGIRPEDFVVNSGTGAVKGTVSRVTQMGGAFAMQLLSDRNAQPFTALMEDGIPAKGDAISFSINKDHVHVFDGEDAKSVLIPVPVKEIRRAKTAGQSMLQQEDTAVKEAAPIRFLKTYFGQFFSLIGLNFLFIFTCLGIITIPASITALNRVCVKMEEDENVFPMKDYLTSFKRDFVKSVMGGSVLLGILLLLVWVIWMYMQLAQSQRVFFFLGLVAVFLFVGVFITSLFFFPMNAMIDLPVRALLINSFVLACQGGWRTAAAFVVSLLSYGLLGIGLFPFSALYIVGFMFTLTNLLNAFILYPLIRIRVVSENDRNDVLP